MKRVASLGCIGAGLALFACGGTPAEPPPKVAKAKPAPPKPRRASPQPGLATDQIKAVVQARYGAVRGCHTLQYAGRETTAGTMTVDLEINPDGSVASASVSETSFDSEQLQQCVLGVTRSLKFPEAPGSTEVSWRFKFRS